MVQGGGEVTITRTMFTVERTIDLPTGGQAQLLLTYQIANQLISCYMTLPPNANWTDLAIAFPEMNLCGLHHVHLFRIVYDSPTILYACGRSKCIDCFLAKVFDQF